MNPVKQQVCNRFVLGTMHLKVSEAISVNEVVWGKLSTMSRIIKALRDHGPAVQRHMV